MTANQITQRAFNAGYLVEKHLPQLAQQIAKGLQNPKSEFAQGFTAGRKQVEIERNLNKSKFLHKLKAEYRTKHIAKQKGKDKNNGIDIDI